MADYKNLLAHFAYGKVLVTDNSNPLRSFLSFTPLRVSLTRILPGAIHQSHARFLPFYYFESGIYSRPSSFPMSIQTPKALAAEDKENGETAYLKFVSQTVKESN